MLLSAFLVGKVVVSATLYPPSGEIPADESENIFLGTQSKDTKKYPAVLYIPSLGINADVQQVGITKKGNMGTPKNFSDVGWFKYGTLPGRVGAALIAGHVDNGLALPGVFKDLKDIKKGDDIYIDTIGGETIRFVVTSLDTYDFNSSTEKVFTSSGKAELKLITCTGSWLKEFRTHDQRLVVTAVEV